MAEQLFGLAASDVPRVKRVLDAFEDGQLNTPDLGGRRRFQSPVPFEWGFTDAGISAGTSGQISLHSTGGDTSKNVSAISLNAANTTANTKVKVWRHQRSGKMYFDKIAGSGVAGSTPFRFGYLSTNSTGYDPQGVALINPHTTTGLVPNSTISAYNLSADRIDPTFGSPTVWSPHKVAVHTHTPSGDLYFERVPTLRRFIVDSNPGKTIPTGTYIQIQGTTGQSPLGTTGFSLALTTGSTQGGFDEIVLADPGVYRVDWSFTCEPVTASDKLKLVQAAMVSLSTAVDNYFGPTFDTALITSTTGGYLTGTEPIRLSGFGFGAATTANTPIRLAVSVSLGSGTANTKIEQLKMIVESQVYV